MTQHAESVVVSKADLLAVIEQADYGTSWGSRAWAARRRLLKAALIDGAES